jgi:hypothetical protein
LHPNESKSIMPHPEPGTGPKDFDYDEFIARGKRWRELLPEGRYAWPLYDWDAFCESDADVPPLIGYVIYWRRPRGLTTFLQLADGLESTPANQQRLRAAESTDENDNIDGDTSGRLAGIVDNPGKYAGTYGQHTGKCGRCGRKLTDPQSIARGIGPDCLGYYPVVMA